MSRNRDVMVYKHGSQWAVKSDGTSRAAGVFSTQKQAIDRGTQLAKNNHGDLSIQGVDGRIRRKTSYGNDPYPPRG
ncbi:DUF2188 domain-containing protein [Olsenella sp. AM30-3LB]|jgi:hypothetical protein|uniref:DUF2188 domain-containing protein n=1 Tax=Olsenella sp. AM30-3LB TaxID=2292359 RepID=UPI000E4A00FB|nr:DUF2188 domain-containing protein [Olsenella sp. AM30-3LB]RHD73625.1 DUF2188 domain-containing protein [Olsenella sp. AM30-3LB]